MKLRAFLLSCLVFFLIVQGIEAATVPKPSSDALDPAQREVLRKQLSLFFTNAAEKSPTFFGGLKQSPGALQAIQGHIATMSDEELSRFRTLTAEIPDWQNAPEILARTIPPETLKQIQSTAADYVQRVPQAEKMRQDVGTLVEVLKLLPDEKLKEIGVQREAIASLETAFSTMSPFQATALQKELSQSPWDAQSRAALAAIPAGLRGGAAELARHGPLSEQDVAELDQYRKELIALFDRIDQLPAEFRDKLGAQSLREKLGPFETAPPDLLFMVRNQISAEALSGIGEMVAMLERMSSTSPEHLQRLETFRGELVETFSQVPSEQRQKIQQSFGSLSSQELSVLEMGLSRVPYWQVAVPALAQAKSSSDHQARLEALKGPVPDPAQVQALEAFRQSTLNYVQILSRQPNSDAKMVEAAQRTLQSATLPDLELLRTAARNLPKEADPQAMLSIVGMSHFDINCVVNIPSICVPLTDLCTPSSINFNFICDLIEGAINGVHNLIDTAIDGVSSFVQGLIDSVTSIANDIWSFITVDIPEFFTNLPDEILDLLKTALNALLDIEIAGIRIGTLVEEGLEQAVPLIQDALGLAGNWWNALGSFTLPTIPCPNAGVHTPFGDVGTGDAVDTFNQYKFFIDTIIGMIPDTEISLAVKIPAQVLYAGFDFLGICLQNAADAAKDALATTRHGEITVGVSDLSEQVGDATSALSLQLLAATNSLTTLINNSGTDIQDLSLRLIIEMALRGGSGSELAFFQLPAPFGQLELVLSILNQVINDTQATGQSVNQATKFRDRGIQSMTSGKFKEAFRLFQSAYREVVKGGGDDDD